jgi:hypothetical protein
MDLQTEFSIEKKKVKVDLLPKHSMTLWVSVVWAIALVLTTALIFDRPVKLGTSPGGKVDFDSTLPRLQSPVTPAKGEPLKRVPEPKVAELLQPHLLGDQSASPRFELRATTEPQRFAPPSRALASVPLPPVRPYGDYEIITPMAGEPSEEYIDGKRQKIIMIPGDAREWIIETRPCDPSRKKVPAVCYLPKSERKPIWLDG